MKNSQKGSINTGLIVVIIVLLATLGYFAFIKKTATTDQEIIPTSEELNEDLVSTEESSPTPLVLSKVQVITPNGGESYKIGDEMNIKWTDDMDAGNRDIIIMTPPGASGGEELVIQKDVFVRSSGIDGTYSKSWKVGGIPVGIYMIFICKSKTDECDLSDRYFTISE